MKKSRKSMFLGGLVFLTIVLCMLLWRVWWSGKCNQELIAAIHRHDAPAVEAWLQRGADPNGHLPKEGSWWERIVRIFLSKQNQDPDRPTVLVESLLGADGEGDKPTDYPEITRALIRYGANINLKGWGWLPINAAASCGKRQSLQILLDKGADANAGRGTEFPALFYAAVTPEMARMMLDHGADVNMQDAHGETALAYAYIRRYPTSLSMARMLLDHGANVTLKNERGESPLSRSAYAQAADLHNPDPWYTLFRNYAGKHSR